MKRMIIAAVFAVLVFAGCNNNPAATESPDTVPSVTPTVVSPEVSAEQSDAEVSVEPSVELPTYPISEALGDIDEGEAVDELTFVSNWADLKFIFPEGSYILDPDAMAISLGESDNYAVRGGEVSQSAVMLYDLVAYLDDGESYVLLRYENLANTSDPRITSDTYIDRMVSMLTGNGYAVEDSGNATIGGFRWNFAEFSETDEEGNILSVQTYYTRRNGSAMMVLIANEMPDYEGMDEVLGNIMGANE